MKDNRPEVMAPVGGPEQLTAAVRCGADAVYFGLQGFNARRNAANFGGEDLRERIEYCHEHGVRVYITINTLVLDSELADMKKTVDTACENGADALIVQDLAVAAYARERWPNVMLIASTQMAVHNAEGTMLLKELGFKRAVLARELTLEEMRSIYDKTGMDLESFVHGAHCMGVSGICYISSMIGGRSGNRGLCAQTCRLDCSVCGRDHALSLKDMSYIKHIKELADAGVCSLKIEGRMKRAEYVAAAVTACRAAIDGKEPDLESLRAVFSRSGFTDGYLTGKRDLSMFGYRTKEDVVAASDVLDSLSRLYEKEPQDIPVDMLLYVQDGEPSQLSVICGSEDGADAVSVTVLGAVPQKARTLPISEEYARRSLSKTGGTPYFLRDLTLCAGDGLMLPSSALNELRRNALEELRKERIAAFESRGAATDAADVPEREGAFRDASGASRSLPGSSKGGRWTPALRARFECLDQLFSGCPKTVILPLSELVRDTDGGASVTDQIRGFGVRDIIAEIPPVIWPSHSDYIRKQLAELKKRGIFEVYAENLGGIELAKEFGFTVHGGMQLNILNSESLAQHAGLGLADACLSFELAYSDMRKLRLPEIPVGSVVYGRLPLMKFRACPARGQDGCGSCTGLNTLTDRIGEEFPIICREKQYSELLNCVPLYVGDRRRPELDFELLYFTTETAQECEGITELYKNGSPFEGRRTAGLYFRELQ